MTPSGDSVGVDTMGAGWSAEFAAPRGQQLRSQPYENAVRPIAQGPDNTSPGLEVSSPGRGCNTVSGRFVIKEYTHAPNGALRVRATFVQHCDGKTAALRGDVVVRVPPP